MYCPCCGRPWHYGYGFGWPNPYPYNPYPYPYQTWCNAPGNTSMSNFGTGESGPQAGAPNVEVPKED